MNVMAQAHNKTREVVAEVAKFGHKVAYRPLFIAALKDFHKAHSYAGKLVEATLELSKRP